MSLNGKSSDPLEYVGLHLDPAARQQWGAGDALRPDEAVMALEDEELDAGQEGMTWLLETILVFLLADFQPERPGLVAARGAFLFRKVLPGMLGRAGTRPVEELVGVMESGVGGMTCSFALGEVWERIEGSPRLRERVRLMMGHLYPGSGPGWLMQGTRRVYVMARCFNPGLVSRRETGLRGLSRDGRRVLPEVEMSWEEMARAFGEGNLKAARARWSALAKRVVVVPIEASGQVVQLQFGRSAATREKYREGARGNSNRRGKRLGGEKVQIPNSKIQGTAGRQGGGGSVISEQWKI